MCVVFAPVGVAAVFVDGRVACGLPSRPVPAPLVDRFPVVRLRWCDRRILQLLGRLVAGMPAGRSGDVHADVEQAALHGRLGPCLVQCLERSAASVAHDRVGRRRTRQEAFPCGGRLAARDMPSRHVRGLVDGDGRDRVATRMDAVEVRRGMHDAVSGYGRYQAPHRLALALRRTRRQMMRLECVLGHEPVQRGARVLGLRCPGSRLYSRRSPRTGT